MKDDLIVKRINLTWPRSQQRCQAEIKDSTKRYRDYRKSDYLCMRHIHYSINGVLLCSLHAGEAVLELLAKEE